MSEATNHLDIASLEVLERELERFPGTGLFVSHDRYFIDRLADRLVEVRDGEVYRHDGGYTAWREKKGDEARSPPALRERLRPAEPHSTVNATPPAPFASPLV